jgi:hypothetical protein
MKSMSHWEDAIPCSAAIDIEMPARKLSFGESEASSVETDHSALMKHVGEKEKRGLLGERFVTLDLGFEWEDKHKAGADEGIQAKVLGEDCVSGASESGSEGGEKRVLGKI